MRKLFVVISVLGLVFSLCGSALAATKAAPAPMSDLVRAQLTEKGKQTLASRQWQVYVTPENKKVATETDVLTFTNGKVLSKNLATLGYKESNLNAGVLDDGTVVWETMQANPDNDLAFFRGELSGNVMKGVISIQTLKGVRTTSHFATSLPTAAAPAPAVAPAPAAAPKKR